MVPQPIRRAAVAGSWYPGTEAALRAEVDRYLESAGTPPQGEVLGVMAPHAGLIYSGPVAAHAYRALEGRRFDVAVLVGPSHYVAFEGVAVYPRGAFETPLGPVLIEETIAADLLRQSSVVRDDPVTHAREHSLEMQLPFLRRVLPDTPIVPLVMGHQHPETIEGLADALGTVLAGRRALLIASSDLSHYYDASTAARLDGRVLEFVKRFDPEGLLAALQAFPEHACGGGPAVAVMAAARALGARQGVVLRYADSGDVSGDKSAVVGYLAAVFGNFQGS
jgi:hypothetical protein